MVPLTEQQKSLAEEAVDRAQRIARRYARIFPEHAEDFESSANWGIVRAASSYQPDKNGVWERWSGLAIRGEIRDFLDNAYHKRRKPLPCAALRGVPGDGGELDRVDAAESLERILGLLPPTYKDVCVLVYKMGLTPTEAGVALGYSKNHGPKLHNLALGFLREELAGRSVQ